MLVSGGGIQTHLRPKSLRIGIHLCGLGVFFFWMKSLACMVMEI